MVKSTRIHERQAWLVIDKTLNLYWMKNLSLTNAKLARGYLQIQIKSNYSLYILATILGAVSSPFANFLTFEHL